jgi:hypothetical protein
VNEHDDERRPLDYEAEGKTQRGERARAFEGRSNRRYASTAEDFHLAIQRAALAAADEQENDEEWYELTRVRVLVSKNPNVKILAATLSKTTDDGR